MNKIVKGLREIYGKNVWIREWHNEKCVDVSEEELLKWVDETADAPVGIIRSGDGCIIKLPSDLIILRSNSKEIYFVSLSKKQRGYYSYDDVINAVSRVIEKAGSP